MNTTDEKDTNLDWLVASSENFQQAVLEDDLVQARAVVDDMRSHGFESQADSLSRDLIKIMNDSHDE